MAGDFQPPACMTSCGEAPRRVSSAASPTRNECAVKFLFSPAECTAFFTLFDSVAAVTPPNTGSPPVPSAPEASRHRNSAFAKTPFRYRTSESAP